MHRCTCCYVEKLPLASKHSAEIPAARKPHENRHRHNVAFAGPGLRKAIMRTMRSSCARRACQCTCFTTQAALPRHAMPGCLGRSPSEVLTLGTSPSLVITSSKTCGKGRGSGSGWGATHRCRTHRAPAKQEHRPCYCLIIGELRSCWRPRQCQLPKMSFTLS